MKASLKRLEHLRSGLHKQAQGRLRVAEERLSTAEAAHERLEALVGEELRTGDVPVALLELSELASHASARVVELLERQRSDCAEVHRQHAVEHRQIEKLLERATSEDRRDEERRVQRALDDWSQTRRSRR